MHNCVSLVVSCCLNTLAKSGKRVSKEAKRDQMGKKRPEREVEWGQKGPKGTKRDQNEQNNKN